VQGHRAPVADLAVDGSGGMLASGSADRSVRVWDVDRGYCTHAFEGHTCGFRPPQALCSPHGSVSYMLDTAAKLCSAARRSVTLARRT